MSLDESFVVSSSLSEEEESKIPVEPSLISGFAFAEESFRFLLAALVLPAPVLGFRIRGGEHHHELSSEELVGMVVRASRMVKRLPARCAGMGSGAGAVEVEVEGEAV